MTAQQRESLDTFRRSGDTSTRTTRAFFSPAFLAESCLDPEVRAELESLPGFFAEGSLEIVEELIAQTVASVAEAALIGQGGMGRSTVPSGRMSSRQIVKKTG